MKRTFQSFPVADLSVIKEQMLNWCNRFNICSFLDNHQYQLQGHSYECLAGCGSVASVSAAAGSALQQLQLFLNEQNDWCFGHLSYDLKAETDHIPSTQADYIGFADVTFFVPEYVLQLSEKEIIIGALQNNHEEVFRQIIQMPVEIKLPVKIPPVKERITKDQYIRIIEQIQQHILRGDCYELNFCMEFFAEGAVINPLHVYQALTAVSPNPFSSFYKVNTSYLLCASPERFLQKQRSKLLSQPVKGTEKRNRYNHLDDEILKQQLKASAKDRSENVMVVDLVRNDLSRVCKEGTVAVDELFGVYTFPQVHQMVSSVSGEVKDGMRFTDLIQSTFPMGSMTGAPKRRVMQLIEEFEHSRRGLFSGAVGYIAPNGDFDFNVVIRSVFYNAITNYLSYLVGSGITFYSNAEQEYEECLWKADAIAKVIGK
ncbi:MAG: anthranilate synthase component I family protein [Lacibacter sp.]